MKAILGRGSAHARLFDLSPSLGSGLELPLAMVCLLSWALGALAIVPTTLAMFNYTDYDNDFLDPSYILSKNFNLSTAAAQQSIIEWADFLAAQGPWGSHQSYDLSLCIF